MPVSSSETARRIAKIATLVILAVLITALAYLQLTGAVSPPLRAVLPLVGFLIVIALLRTGIAVLPPQYDRAIFRGRINVIDFVKSIACALAALTWAVTALRFVSDTTIGVVILFAPVFLLLGLGTFFLGRSMFKRSP
jgi:hypothetical protein